MSISEAVTQAREIEYALTSLDTVPTSGGGGMCMCTHVHTCMYAYVFLSVVEGTMLAPPKPRIINSLRKQVLVTEEGRKEKHQKTASHRVTGLWCCHWGPTSPNSFSELRTGLQYLPRTPTVNKRNSLLFFYRLNICLFKCM